MLRRISVFSFLLIMGGMAYGVGQIDIAYSPYTISQPGSYIVVKDLITPQDFNCITIATSNVTLDLNGHTLYGAGTVVGSYGIGIFADLGRDNITITNGIVRDFLTHGIYLYSRNNRVSNVRSLRNGFYGIYVSTNGSIKDNLVEGNGFNGIVASDVCVVTGCNVYQNGADGISTGLGSTITGNSVSNNSGNGILSYFGCTVTGNSVSNNGVAGISASADNAVTGNSVYYNKGIGISASEACTVIGNSIGYSGSHGIYIDNGSTAKDNSVRDSVGNGIYATNNCRIVGNTCSGNGYGSATAAGIRVSGTDNSIEKNLLTANDIGLQISATGNFYASNRASGSNYSNYSTIGSQTNGASIDTSLTNVSFYYQPNRMVNAIAGYDIQVLKESPNVIVRNMIW